MNRYKSPNPNDKAVQKSLDRMKIMSMVPLELESSQSSPGNISAIDQTWDLYRNTLSDYSQMLEFNGKDNHNVPDSFAKLNKGYEYHRTTYKPSFRKNPSMHPEPASYNPEYKSVQPSAPTYTISKIQQKSQRSTTNSTTGDILNQFQNNIRGFDLENVKNIADTVPGEIKMPDTRIKHGFDEQLTREFDLAAKPVSKDVDFYVPPPPEQKALDFSKMTDRNDNTKVDSGRSYDKAFQQFKKLHDTTHVPTITKQMPRDYKAPKNPRVAFLEKLAEEQNSLMKKITEEREKRIQKPRVVKSSFAQQASRERAFNSHLAKEQFRDSKYKIDPAKSLQYVYPRVPYVKIPPPPKFESPKKQEKFWSAF